MTVPSRGKERSRGSQVFSCLKWIRSCLLLTNSHPTISPIRSCTIDLSEIKDDIPQIKTCITRLTLGTFNTFTIACKFKSLISLALEFNKHLKGWIATKFLLQLFSIKRFTMSYSVVLYVQNMWKCNYKLLKAKKTKSCRLEAKIGVERRLESVYFSDVVITVGYCLVTWCSHVNWKANKRLNMKLLVALVYDKHFEFYQRHPYQI